MSEDWSDWSRSRRRLAESVGQLSDSTKGVRASSAIAGHSMALDATQRSWHWLAASAAQRAPHVRVPSVLWDELQGAILEGSRASPPAVLRGLARLVEQPRFSVQREGASHIPENLFRAAPIVFAAAEVLAAAATFSAQWGERGRRQSRSHGGSSEARGAAHVCRVLQGVSDQAAHCAALLADAVAASREAGAQSEQLARCCLVVRCSVVLSALSVCHVCLVALRAAPARGTAGSDAGRCVHLCAEGRQAAMDVLASVGRASAVDWPQRQDARNLRVFVAPTKDAAALAADDADLALTRAIVWRSVRLCTAATRDIAPADAGASPLGAALAALAPEHDEVGTAQLAAALLGLLLLCLHVLPSIAAPVPGPAAARAATPAPSDALGSLPSATSAMPVSVPTSSADAVAAAATTAGNVLPRSRGAAASASRWGHMGVPRAPIQHAAWASYSGPSPYPPPPARFPHLGSPSAAGSRAALSNPSPPASGPTSLAYGTTWRGAPQQPPSHGAPTASDAQVVAQLASSAASTAVTTASTAAVTTVISPAQAVSQPPPSVPAGEDMDLDSDHERSSGPASPPAKASSSPHALPHAATTERPSAAPTSAAAAASESAVAQATAPALLRASAPAAPAAHSLAASNGSAAAPTATPASASDAALAATSTSPMMLGAARSTTPPPAEATPAPAAPALPAAPTPTATSASHAASDLDQELDRQLDALREAALRSKAKQLIKSTAPPGRTAGAADGEGAPPAQRRPASPDRDHRVPPGTSNGNAEGDDVESELQRLRSQLLSSLRRRSTTDAAPEAGAGVASPGSAAEVRVRAGSGAARRAHCIALLLSTTQILSLAA